MLRLVREVGDLDPEPGGPANVPSAGARFG